MTERSQSPQPSPQEVANTIAYLSGLSDDQFAECLADCIMDPVPEETVAFRSPELVNRSVIAARYLIDHVNTVIKTRAGEDESNKRVQRSREMFRNKVGRERRVLEAILSGLKAQRGILDNAPNPRARALRRLKQLHLAEYQELVREETERIAEERREKRRQQKDAARAARRQAGLSAPS